LRNAIVTGRPSIMPVHGGGTSFYIGNNQHARGVWNTAGGLLSGEVVRERQELAAELGVAPAPEAEQAAAIGRALYRRAAHELADDPARWLWLELRKAWLLLGNDELSQDYDVAGERELLPWWANRGVPFSAVLAVGLVGVVAVRRRTRHDPSLAARWRPWAWMLGAQAFAVVAANLLFFTSAQHRLPLVVPLGILLGPGVRWLGSGWRWRAGGLRSAATTADRRALGLSWALVAVLLAQGAWPRQRREGPTPEHYYNLAIAHVQLGQPQAAVEALDRAVRHRPDHPVILLERATLDRRLGHLDEAAADLDRLGSLPDVPPWIARRVAEERLRVQALRRSGGRSR
jgi:tetratricopeptide (TPR) repeat protein